MKRVLLLLLGVAASCKSYGDSDATSDGGTLESGDASIVADDAGDAATPADGGAGTACDRTAHFKDVRPIAELNSSKQQEAARLTPDELTVYFASNRDIADAGLSPNWDVFVAKRSARTAPFGTPVKVGGAVAGFAPTVTPDELTLFTSARVAGGADAISMQRRNAPTDSFAAPSSPLDSYSNYYSFVPASGAALYFFSIRGAADTAWYRAPLGADGTPGAATKVPGLDGNIETAIVSPDELTTYYSVWASDLHMWTASRSSTSQPFGAPIQLTEVDGAIETYPDWISPDGCRLYFSGDRPGATGDGYNIWMATR